MEEKREIIVRVNVERFPSSIVSTWERAKARDMGCPRCGSKNLSFKKSEIFGPIPEKKILGKEKVILSCNNCGEVIPLLFVFEEGGKQTNLLEEVLEHLLERYSEEEIPNYYLFFREMRLLELAVEADDRLYRLNLIKEFDRMLREKMKEKRELFEKTREIRDFNKFKLIFGYFSFEKRGKERSLYTLPMINMIGPSAMHLPSAKGQAMGEDPPDGPQQK